MSKKTETRTTHEILTGDIAAAISTFNDLEAESGFIEYLGPDEILAAARAAAAVLVKHKPKKSKTK